MEKVLANGPGDRNSIPDIVIPIIQKTVPRVSLHNTWGCYILTFDPAPKMLFQGNTPEGSDTFQRPVIERDRVGELRLMIWEKVKVPFCHYSHAPEESNL